MVFFRYHPWYFRTTIFIYDRIIFFIFSDDTVFIYKDSIVPCKKNHYPKYKEIKVPYTVTDTLYVPVITTIILKDRKESSLDSTTFSIIRDNTEQIQKPIEIPDSVMSDSIE